MKRFLITLFFLFFFLCSNAQKEKNQIDFKGGYDGFIHFIIANIRYPFKAREMKITGVYFTQIFISENGMLDSISVWNNEKIISTEVKRTIRKTKEMWFRGGKRVITVPFLFYFSGDTTANYIMIPDGLANSPTKFPYRTIMFSPIYIGGYAFYKTKEYGGK